MITMHSKKIYITSSGIISSFGIGLDAFKDGLTKAPVTTSFKDFEFHSLDSAISCVTVNGYDPVEILGKKGLRLKDNATKLVLGAFELGLKSIMEGADDNSRPGICVGTAFGSVQSIGDFLSDSIVNGVGNVNPQAFANTVINSPTGNTNIRFVARNHSSTISTGFNSGIDALIYAFNHIQRGYIEAIVAGGLEEISYYSLLGLQRTGVLSSSGKIKPFATDADGIVPGEGCALFLFDTEASMKASGRKAIVEVVGTASGFDVSLAQNAKSDGEVAAYVLSEVCKDAGISPKDVDFVASSASGNRLTDSIEAAAIAKVFGTSVPVTAYKSFTGECYGASGALNLGCAISDLKNKQISGIGDSGSRFNNIALVTSPVKKDSKYCIVNSVSCDGNCGAVLLKNVE
jgi:3-oxoacyl-(acyl-carrier-protein) synthase